MQRLVEDDLVKRLGFKRHIVRQVLNELCRNGLLEHVRNKGMSVRLVSPEEVELIYEMRELLEIRAVERLPLPAAPILIETLVSLQHEHDDAVRREDLRRVHRSNRAFHQTLFGACGNPYLVAAIERAGRAAQAIRYHALIDPVLLESQRQQHWEMIAALKVGDRDSLVQLHRLHLLPSKNAYLNSHAIKHRVGLMAASLSDH